jgi:hypothetical protein
MEVVYTVTNFVTSSQITSDSANALFAWLISHQPALLFSQNKPTTSNQPTVLFSQNKPTTSNQPTVLFSQNKPAPTISHQPLKIMTKLRVSSPKPEPIRHR